MEKHSSQRQTKYLTIRSWINAHTSHWNKYFDLHHEQIETSHPNHVRRKLRAGAPCCQPWDWPRRRPQSGAGRQREVPCPEAGPGQLLLALRALYMQWKDCWCCLQGTQQRTDLHREPGKEPHGAQRTEPTMVRVHWAWPLGRKIAATLTPEEGGNLNKNQWKKIQEKYDERKKKYERRCHNQPSSGGAVPAPQASCERPPGPGRCGRAEGHVLERRGGSSVCGKSPPRKTNKSSSLLSLKLVFKNKNKINAHGIKLFILRLKKRNLKKQYSKFWNG